MYKLKGGRPSCMQQSTSSSSWN